MKKMSPFTKDVLDFTKKFKNYMLGCKEVYSFGIKAENYQFYIELCFGIDRDHFFTDCPYDLSQISLSTRANASNDRIIESYETTQSIKTHYI